MKLAHLAIAVLTLTSATAGSAQAGFLTSEPPQMRGDTPATNNGWEVKPLITIGEEIDGYYPPGVPDGIGAYQTDPQTVRVFVNHELGASSAYAFTLDNGAMLRGSRVTYLDLHRYTREIIGAGLAFGTIRNRAGAVVTSGSDLEFGGLNRLCSSSLYEGGTYHLEDTIYFAGEETSGGSVFALDVANRELWAAPWLGRAAFENVALVDTGDENQVALLIGDDRQSAPLLLYVGEKTGSTFLGRNGLAQGRLYAWVTDSGDSSPQDWNGTGTSRSGTFIELDYYRPDLAGNGDYDPLGFATQTKQNELVAAAGGFRFSRPEDVSTNPDDPTQAVFASTGRGSVYPADTWGSVYIVDLAFGEPITASLRLVYDGDDSGAGAVLSSRLRAAKSRQSRLGGQRKDLRSGGSSDEPCLALRGNERHRILDVGAQPVHRDAHADRRDRPGPPSPPDRPTNPPAISETGRTPGFSM